MKFETARVCVLQRSCREPELPEWVEAAMETATASLPIEIQAHPEFTFEVIAWPPGEIDGGLLPHNGDQITLPGHETPFRVCDRTLHWPPPTSPEARRGEVRVDLIVEPMPASSSARTPFGRPGEESVRLDGRWLEGEVRYFEARKTRGGGNDVVVVQLSIDGVGTLAWYLTRNFQAAGMFPDMTGLNSGTDDGHVIPAEIFAHLTLGQRFECLVGPGATGRTEIRDVRPQTKEEN
jgi:hypothetical protein